MAPTSPWLLAALIGACVGSVVLTVAFWDRVRVPVVARSTGILVAIVLALAAAGVGINREFGFFASWSELFGSEVPPPAAAVAPARPVPGLTAIGLAAARSDGLIVHLRFAGVRSGIDRPGIVYLPPQYFDPAYHQRRFPVLELLTGSPGDPGVWLRMHVPTILVREIAAGRALPLVLVMPQTNGVLLRDEECANAVSGPQDDTYLTEDVYRDVTHEFRVLRARSAWALAGYSTGGYCAVNLALRHPTTYAAAASMSGYFHPELDATTGSIFHADRLLYDENSPSWLLQHSSVPPDAFLLSASGGDPQSVRDLRRFLPLVRAPLEVTAIMLTHGGHNFRVWNDLMPTILDWVSARLAMPLAQPLRPKGVRVVVRCPCPGGHHQGSGHVIAKGGGTLTS